MSVDLTNQRARLCAVIAEPTVESARAALNRAAAVADLAELRLDSLVDVDFASLDWLGRLLEGRQIPAIITCRSVEEGGLNQVEDPRRIRLLVEGAKRWADYCDIEARHYQLAAALRPEPSKLILSHHDFGGAPANPSELYGAITQFPAAVHKVSFLARSITDSLAAFDLLERARDKGRQLIAVAMGSAGVITRILGPAWGSFLTYGSLEAGRESAPGQLTCRELKDSYRVHSITRETSIAGVIGNPVMHSASPAMHNAAFAALGIDWAYLPFEVDDLGAFFDALVYPASRRLDWNLRGMSVTIPHKTAVVPLMDEVSDSARAMGAVNTVVVDGSRLEGHNTDMAGAMVPLDRLIDLTGRTCAVLGAGGAARAVIAGLLERGAVVEVYARDVSKAFALRDLFGIEANRLSDFESSSSQVVINATPVGMRGHESGSPVPATALRDRSLVYELVYNPIETELLRDARRMGCRALSGIEMLVAQAALQFKLWTGLDAPIEVMQDAAQKWISEESKSAST